MKKINNKGFTLIELLTVMAVLVIIFLIAIPSITSSLSRSEDKQLEAQKQTIVSDVVINLKKSDFANFSSFESGSCFVTVESLYNIGYVTDKIAKDKKGNFIQGCVGYSEGELTFFDTCGSECALNG